MSLKSKQENSKETKSNDGLFGMKGSTQTDYNDYEDYTKYLLNDLDVGASISGKPELFRFEPREDKKSTSIRLRIVDDLSEEYVDCYCNIPLTWPIIKGVNKSFDYYRTTFDLITGVFYLIDETMILDNNGDPINRIDEINMKQFIEFLGNKESITIEVTEGNPKTEYNSLKVLKIE